MARTPNVDSPLSSIRVDPNSPVPKHRQIYEALREMILEGKLKANDALPSTRQSSRRFHVSRNTVLTAYELLVAEGYVVSRGGAGTFVAPNAERPAPDRNTVRLDPRPLSITADVLRVWHGVSYPSRGRPFAPSSPALDVFPFDTWSTIIGRQARANVHGAMADGDPHGFLPLRTLIARHLQTMRSCRCAPEQIIITSGAQLAYALCSMLLIDDGDAVWVEDPGFPNARRAFRSRTSRIIPVPLDESGIDILAGQALSPEPRVIYVTPTHQWPLGVTMPVQRRLELLEFAARCKAWIVEDDYDGDLRFDGKTYAALAGLDKSDRVIHIGTFSKTLCPGLRLGYVAVPYDLVNSFLAGREILDRFPNSTIQSGVAEFMEQGLYAKHVRKMQTIYAERHQILRTEIESKLPGVLAAKPSPGGTFTVVTLVGGLDDVAVAKALAEAGIESSPLSPTYFAYPKTRGLLLGHAVAPPDQIRTGVDAIRRLLPGVTTRPVVHDEP